MIYLDNAATTRPSELAITSFIDITRNHWDNPSSTLREPGIEAKRIINESRQRIAYYLKAEPEQIVFTSGSTEAANWIIRSFAYDAPPENNCILIDPMSHPCMYNTCNRLCPSVYTEELRVHNGVINVDKIEEQIKRAKQNFSHVLICVTYVNNETGVIQPVKEICDLAHEYSCYVLADMTQAITHCVPIDQKSLGYDFAFASAHKFGGLKGTGFVYIKNPRAIDPLFYGGHQENNHRAGTENVAGIFSMTEQFCDVRSHIFKNEEWLWSLKEYLLKFLPSFCHINFQDVMHVHSIVSITIDGENSQDVVSKLALKGIYISAGSACSTGEDRPSRVLMKAGLSEDEARRTIRVSFGADNTFADIDTFINALHMLKGG